MIKGVFKLFSVIFPQKSGFQKAVPFFRDCAKGKRRFPIAYLIKTCTLFIVFITAGVFAQYDISPTINIQSEKHSIYQIANPIQKLSGSSEIVNSNLKNENIKVNPLDALCQPTYLYGCSDNDGFTDFALEQIQNLNNGCDNNTGYNGWSEYYTLDTALLIPGNDYEVTMATGYSNQHVNIWIDFNDDFILSSDEIVLNDYIMQDPGTLYNVQITLPANALAGQHAMRAMAVWPDAFVDPCGSYSYGEAEDYYVQIEGGEYGMLEGYITEASGGNPVEGASIDIGNFLSAISDSEGYYCIGQVLTGAWNVSCTKEGFNVDSAMVTISQDVVTSLNFQLTAPQMVVTPATVSVTLEPNTFLDEVVNISNTGNGNLTWTGQIVLSGEGVSDDLFDLQFDWPVGIGAGEAGIECDGNFIYTSKWNGAEFYKYELDGTYISSFTCGAAGEVRDMAFDGTYFYGAAANSTVYQMDFTNGILVSQFTAPADIRAIAYNEDDNTFYGNNWGTDIVKFDMVGNNLGSFSVGPVGASYYGFACDNYSNGAPFLWGYAQTGATLNELIQIQLPSGIETGVTFDVGSVAAVGTGLAGGLAITDGIVFGYYTLLGTAQAANIWGLELCESENSWLSIEPDFGIIAAGQNQNFNLHINSMDLIPGLYTAEINFNTDPTISAPIIEVTLQVEGLIPASNLSAGFDCTDVILTWDMPAGSVPDSWNVYRNGTLHGNANTMTFTDPVVLPEVEYGFFVKAVYSGEESQPTSTITVTAPTPVNLEPLIPIATYQGANTVEISWETPEACLSPDEYRIYRFEFYVGSSTTLSFTDIGVPNGYYEYFVKADYYFGESENSVPASVVVGIEDLNTSEFEIYPNPASGSVNIKSPVLITKMLVFNNSGDIVLEKEMNTYYYNLDISNFENGIYYIKMKTTSGDILKKITVSQ